MGLERMEWSGRYRDSTGSRMGFENQDCSWYRSCPGCGGINPEDTPYYKAAEAGHRAGCELLQAIEGQEGIQDHDQRCDFRICRAHLKNPQGEAGHSRGACCPCTCKEVS
jgi:hypothetical protein